MKKLICVHGWDGSPNIGFWPWLQVEAQKLGLEVHAPQLPGGENPELPRWIKKIDTLVGTDAISRANTILIGHSLGCDAVLRYVERLPISQRIGAIILIAPFIDESDLDDLEMFNGQAISVQKVKTIVHQKIAFFSSNDPHVPLQDGIEYQHRLGAQIHILKNRKHFSGDDGCTNIPEVLEALKKIVSHNSSIK